MLKAKRVVPSMEKINNNKKIKAPILASPGREIKRVLNINLKLRARFTSRRSLPILKLLTIEVTDPMLLKTSNNSNKTPKKTKEY